MIQGINGNHESSVHQVTGCIHDHGTEGVKSGGAMKNAVVKDTENAARMMQETDAQFSLSAWMEKLFGSGKRLLFKIWGDSNGSQSVSGEAGEEAAQAVPVNGQNSVGTTQEINPEAAANQQGLPHNPYFEASPAPMTVKKTPVQKIRAQIKSMAANVGKRFLGQKSLQTKQERPKEDLRKHSRYRQDDLEIDCILTDDSYLLDSYDKKGEYSKLSAKK